MRTPNQGQEKDIEHGRNKIKKKYKYKEFDNHNKSKIPHQQEIKKLIWIRKQSITGKYKEDITGKRNNPGKRKENIRSYNDGIRNNGKENMQQTHLSLGNSKAMMYQMRIKMKHIEDRSTVHNEINQTQMHIDMATTMGRK